MRGGKTECRNRHDRATTYVLVHGAWHGGWCWRRVADSARRRPPRLHADADRPRRAQASAERRHHARDLHPRYRSMSSRPKTSATSFWSATALAAARSAASPTACRNGCGGWSISTPALPENGKSAFDLDRAGSARSAPRSAHAPSSGGLSMPPPPAAAFGVTDPADAAWVERHLTPHPTADLRAADRARPSARQWRAGDLYPLHRTGLFQHAQERRIRASRVPTGNIWKSPPATTPWSPRRRN